MSSVSDTAGRSPARIGAAAVLGIIAILLIIAAIIYFTEPAKSLPSILGTITHPAKRASEHRSLRGIITLVVGVLCLVGGVFAFMWKGKDRN